MDSMRMLARRLLALAPGMWSLVLVFMVVLVIYRFFPTSRLETASPSGHRAFTLNEGFVDISINLYVSDWPYTFLAPLRIGDLYWPENYSAQACWTNDGTAVVFQQCWNTGSGYYFTGAYDFREHRHLHSNYVPKDGGGLHQEISSLVTARGGLGAVIRCEDGKGGEHPYTPLPLWTWVPPGLILIAGYRAAARSWRRKDIGLRD